VDTVGGNFSGFTNDFADDTFLASNVFRRFVSDVPAFLPNRAILNPYFMGGATDSGTIIKTPDAKSI